MTNQDTREGHPLPTTAELRDCAARAMEARPNYRGHDPIITQPLPGGVVAICHPRCVLCAVPWPCPSAIHIARHGATTDNNDNNGGTTA